jgi:hypothetical protein
MKQLKLESVYKDAYIDRYRRLGYTVVSVTESEDNGVKYSLITLRRDENIPSYGRLVELEAEVDSLCEQAKKAGDAPDEVKTKRKKALFALFVSGISVMAAGIILVVCGILIPELFLAIGGWSAAVVGAVLTVVWSFLREKWRMRKVDIADDAEHPGFGVDIYSRKVEECLKEAESLTSGAAK